MFIRNLIVLVILIFATTYVFGVEKNILLTNKNTVFLDLAFDNDTTNEVVTKVQTLNPKLPIYLILISPGGEVVAGLSMIDNLRGISKNVHTITVFAASMGFATVQSLGKRYITKHGVLMSHRASGGMKGQFPNGELESRLMFWNKRITNLDQETVDRTNGKLTLEQYQKMIVNELWCEGKDCIELGLADEIVSVKCDSSLFGKTTKDISIKFLGQVIKLTIERNNCPLIQGYSLVDQSIGDIPYNRTSPEFNSFIDDYMQQINTTKSILR